jgi:hypothetical protein
LAYFFILAITLIFLYLFSRIEVVSTKEKAELYFLNILGFKFDLGGFASLYLTAIVLPLLFLIFVKRGNLGFLNNVKKYLTGSTTTASFINCFLFCAAAIAIWLSIRLIMKYTTDFLMTDNYLQYRILDIISYLLIANLCFGLINNLKKAENMRYISSAAIQATLIGIIVFIPKSGDNAFLQSLSENLMGVIGFFIVAATISLILFVLIRVVRFFSERSETYIC